MKEKQRVEQFQVGTGASVSPTRTCAECGFTSDKPKLFKRDGDGHTCTTGHYEDAEGNLKRARNMYARH